MKLFRVPQSVANKVRAGQRRGGSCPMRGPAIGRLICNCGGSPPVFSCSLFGRCVLTTPGKPYPLDMRRVDGSRVTIRPEEKPAVCSRCERRA